LVAEKSFEQELAQSRVRIQEDGPGIRWTLTPMFKKKKDLPGREDDIDGIHVLQQRMNEKPELFKITRTPSLEISASRVSRCHS
jgi:hypothetical protein